MMVLRTIIDKFQGLDKENFETISPYIDMVKIYGALRSPSETTESY